eukprot:1621945-Rhodomonas_salina.2
MVLRRGKTRPRSLLCHALARRCPVLTLPCYGQSSPSLYGSERAVRPATQDSYYSNYSNNNLASRGLYGSMPARGEAAPIQAMY